MDHRLIPRPCCPPVASRMLLPFLAGLLACWPSGCGPASAGASGGTPGTVTFRGATLTGLRIALYADSGELVAVGATNAEGRFELHHEKTADAVKLPAGRYRVTLESSAGEVLPLPTVYSDKAKSPLTVEWPGGDGPLQVVVPDARSTRGT